MPVTAYHILTATTPDDPSYEIRPSHWNSQHVVTLNAVGSEISNAFGNGGGVTFGLSADGKITASAPAAGGGLTAVNVSAGTTSNNLSNLVFSNSNNVSFGLDGSTITATVTLPTGTDTWAATGNNTIAGLNTTGTFANDTYIVSGSGGVFAGVTNNTLVLSAPTTYAGSGFTSTTTAGTAVVATNNSAGLSMGVPAYITTAMQSGASTQFVQANAAFAGTNASGTIASNGISVSVNAQSTQPVAVSAANGSFNFSTLTFANSNGVSFSTGTQGLFATVKTDYQSSNANYLTSQSNQAISAANGSFTFQTATFANSNGVSFSTGTQGLFATIKTDYAGTGTSATNASLTLNSNGLAISVAGGGTINQTGPNIADGNGNTITSGTVVFSNSNGVSFGLNASTMTASVNAVAVAAGGATASTGTVVFSNSNNITFGLNNNTLTASYADPYETYFVYPDQAITTMGNPINGTASVIYFPLGHNLKATKLDFFGSVSVATAANTSSAAILWSATAALYSQNGNTLSSIYSTATNSEIRWQSNSTASVTGVRIFSVPLTISTDQGYYFLAVNLSTRATGHTGAATTSLGNSISMMGVGSAQYGAFTVADFGAATTSSGNAISNGLYSGTTNFATIGLSNISFVGTFGQRAPIVIRAWST